MFSLFAAPVAPAATWLTGKPMTMVIVAGMVVLSVRMARALAPFDESAADERPEDVLTDTIVERFGQMRLAPDQVDTGYMLAQRITTHRPVAIAEKSTDHEQISPEAFLDFAEAAYLKIRRAEIDNDPVSVRSLFSAVGFAAWRGASDARRSEGVRLAFEELHVRDSRIVEQKTAGDLLLIEAHLDFAHRARIVNSDGTSAVTGQPAGTHDAVRITFERKSSARSDEPFAVSAIRSAPYEGGFTAIGSDEYKPVAAKAGFNEAAGDGSGLNYAKFATEARIIIEEIEEAIYQANPEIAKKSCTEAAYLTLALQAKADHFAKRPRGRKLLDILEFDVVAFADMPQRYYALVHTELSAVEHGGGVRRYRETWVFSRGKSESSHARHGGWLLARINPDDESAV